MIKIGKQHIHVLMQALRKGLPERVFGLTCRFAAIPPEQTNPGAIALEVTTVGFYDGPHLLCDVVSWIELEPLHGADDFTTAVDETVWAHRMAHKRKQDELDLEAKKPKPGG